MTKPINSDEFQRPRQVDEFEEEIEQDPSITYTEKELQDVSSTSFKTIQRSDGQTITCTEGTSGIASHLKEKHLRSSNLPNISKSKKVNGLSIE